MAQPRYRKRGGSLHVELAREQRCHLLTGKGYFGPAFADDESESLAWSIHGEQLLAEHIAANPGTRPKAWWKFDAPDPYPPYIDPADEGRYPPGVLKMVDGEPVCVTQDEADYLRRNGLLTYEEIAVLEEED
jgi:hypothetical protein